MVLAEANTGMSIFQIQELCRPDRIEETMHLLCILNHWARAYKQIFYDDRQGLYNVKCVILRQAWWAGQLTARGYKDGKPTFGVELQVELAAREAARSFLAGLQELAASHHERNDESAMMIRQLYTALVGEANLRLAGLQPLSEETVLDFLCAELHDLILSGSSRLSAHLALSAAPALYCSRSPAGRPGSSSGKAQTVV